MGKTNVMNFRIIVASSIYARGYAKVIDEVMLIIGQWKNLIPCETMDIMKKRRANTGWVKRKRLMKQKRTEFPEEGPSNFKLLSNNQENFMFLLQLLVVKKSKICEVSTFHKWTLLLHWTRRKSSAKNWKSVLACNAKHRRNLEIGLRVTKNVSKAVRVREKTKDT